MEVKDLVSDEIDVSEQDVEFFSKEGFFVFSEPILSDPLRDVPIFCEELDKVMKGEFSTNNPPDKLPNQKMKEQKRTLQMINVWKASTHFYQLVRSSNLGRVVAKLAKWDGARLAQDQVWIKPPQSGPLAFHRDSTYFDFDPADVVTVWISFDDLKGEKYEKMGPLEYVHGSHLWSDKRTGSANQFFDPNYRSLVNKAAIEEGINDLDQLKFKTVSIPSGGCSIHNGRTWHGSGPNTSNNPRRGLGIHFIPESAKFSTTKKIGKLWLPYKREDSQDLPEEYMPVVWSSSKEKKF